MAEQRLQRPKDRRDELLERLEKGKPLTEEERDDLARLCERARYNNWNCDSEDWAEPKERPSGCNLLTIGEWQEEVAENDLMLT